MKYILIVPDGMADQPIEELGGRTPLEAARTPNMDYLAKHGVTGLVKTIPKNMHPGSDIGNMSILGYDPKKYHTGRAPLEAANQDIILNTDEVAFRCNLVTIVDGKLVDYSAGHIQTKEAAVLIKSLNETIDQQNIQFYVGKSYRHTLVVKTREPQDYMNIETTAPHDILGKQIKNYLPKGKESQMLLKMMEQSKIIFEGHDINTVRIDLRENPATMIWLWGQGTSPNLPDFKDKYGLKGAIISAVDLVNGIGKLAGLTVINVPGATGYYDTDYAAKGKYALDALKKHDFVYVHIESPDEAGHNGELNEKIRAIENIDKEIVGPALEYSKAHHNVRIMVLPDHPTPVSLRTHTDEPVCFVISGKDVAHNGASEYNEKSCKEQNVQFQSGEELMNHFLKPNI